MQIAVFGARGRIGREIVLEALLRGHSVRSVHRRPPLEPVSDVPSPAETVVEGNVADAGSVRESVQGAEAVVNAVNGLGHDNPGISSECVAPLLDGMAQAGLRRLLVVGTAGTLAVPGGRRMDQPDFPVRLRAEAEAHAAALTALRAQDPAALDWTYFSPPAVIEPGQRSADVILGLDELMTNEDGASYISRQDYACALIDELESPRHLRTRFTAVSRHGGTR
jgi:putative NADH-flavin reductase